MDSVVLLHLLHDLAPRYQWRLCALHVHHGISPNADTWAEFCTTLCSRLNIPLLIEWVDIAPLRDEHGIEAAARKLRHAAFAKQSCDFVALAHHADDQAETLLLQLLRGAGIKGVAAMPVLSNVEGPVLSRVEGLAPTTSVISKGGVPATVRPLLDVPRDRLLDYAQQCGLSWIEDESNADAHYPRNFLRHRLLPTLEERFPSYRDTLARSAKNFAEADELLDELARQDMQSLVSDTTLEVSLLRALSYKRAKNLLRYFLHTQQAPMPQVAQLDDMLRQLCDAREDAAVCINYGEWQVRRYRDKVYALRALAEFDQNTVLFWSGESELEWPALSTRLVFNRGNALDEELSSGARLLAKSSRQQAGSCEREAAQAQSGLKQKFGHGISLAKLQHAPVTLRLRNGGETLRPHPNAATRSLKNLLQEHRVPPWQRERLPLLYCGSELVCVVGVAIQAEYQAQQTEESVLPSFE